MALPTPTLHTARLRLRPFSDADANDLFALQSNAHVLRYWDAPPWSERARAGRFIAACRQMAEGGTGARLAGKLGLCDAGNGHRIAASALLVHGWTLPAARPGPGRDEFRARRASSLQTLLAGIL